MTVLLFFVALLLMIANEKLISKKERICFTKNQAMLEISLKKRNYMYYNPFSLKDETFLITGATSGIGRATAIECSKMGANITITGWRYQEIEMNF